ncbi:MAG: isopentenyl phosphate kinase [Anaerolineales bacterium]
MERHFSDLQLLKLGGSLITDKSKAHTPHPEVIRRLAEEIAEAKRQNAALQLIVGNGAGSFGHVPAKRYGTREGVHTAAEWRGLNQIVMEILWESELPAMVFSPSASVTSDDGRILTWNLEPIKTALEAGLLPVIHGDVAFDVRRGGTILSTEDLFAHLAQRLRPKRILLAGIEAGVWADYPACTRLMAEITPVDWEAVAASLGGSAGTDVTGGMASKVRQSLELVKEIPGLEVRIFSGEEEGLIRRALGGEEVGTLIRNGSGVPAD